MRSTWRVVGASAKGTSHQKVNMPCQDAHDYAVSRRTAIIVVADGAGSANKSDMSAQLAARATPILLRGFLTKRGLPQSEAAWRKAFLWAFNQVRQRIVKLAEEENSPLKEFHTTLVCAVATSKSLAIAQVGDNFAVAQAEYGRWFTAIKPHRGEYADETFFLTMENGLQYVETRFFREPICTLTVMSDGLLRLALSADKEPHVPFFEPLLGFVNKAENATAAQEELLAFLESDRVCARTDDDKTLVVAQYCSAG
jgi:hypothetical protein